jgi:hypothetical protein
MGELAPLPWTSWIGTTVTSSFWMVPVPVPSSTVAPVTFVTLSENVSFGSTVVSPFTVTLAAKVDEPAGIVWPVSASAT